MSRPKHNIELEELEKLMQFNPSLASTAAWFKVSERTIERRIKESHGEDMSFVGFRTKFLAPTKIGLVQKAVSMAMDGNPAMLKFYLKNLCSWEENPTAISEDSLITGLEFI